MERLGIEIAGALVPHAGRQIGHAGLVGRVLRGTAGERELERDQGRGFVHHPGLDPARADHPLDLGGLRAAVGERREGGGEDGHAGKSSPPSGRRKGKLGHVCFPSGRAVVSRIR